MWIYIIGYLSFFKYILCIIISIIICFIFIGNERIFDKFYFNKFIFYDVLFDSIVLIVMRQMKYSIIIYPILLVDALLLCIALIKDIKSELFLKDKLYSIVLHIAEGFLLYVILEIIGEVICIVLDILGFVFRPIINFIYSNSIGENILLILAILVFFIIAIISLVPLCIIFEIIRLVLSPLSFLFGDNTIDLDLEDKEEDEWVQDKYGEMCEVDHSPTLSGGKYEDSKGEWHDLYGPYESSYRDDDNNWYDIQ